LKIIIKPLYSFFFIIFLFIGIFIFSDYGLSWDERFQRHIGVINCRYVIEGDPRLITDSEKYYGPVFEVLLVAIEKILNLNDKREVYFIRHLVTFLLFYTSVFFFYLLCKHRYRSWKIGLLGSLFLILSPRIFADSFYNSKDLAFLSVFIISIYTLVKYLDKKTLLRASLHALICAILIDIRIVGIIVPCFTFLFVTIDLILGSKSTKIKIKNIIPSSLLYGFLLICFTILFWPILWDGPIYHFIQAFIEMKQYPWGGGSVLYLGNYVEATNLPWHYIPLWLIITTPVLYTFMFFLGSFTSIKSLLKRPLNFYSNNQKRDDLIFLLWFFLPLLAVIALNSILYNSWRHMFFIYPAFLVISLKGIISLFEFTKLKFKGHAHKIMNIILIFIILFSLISTTQFMVKNHPYQNVYFNPLAGKDMESVKNNFVLDYWGLSYRQALEYILKNDAEKNVTVYAADYPGKLNADILTPSDRDRLKYVEKPDDAKYFLSNYYWGHREKYPHEDEFYSIKIGGAKIMVVYKLKENFEKNPTP